MALCNFAHLSIVSIKFKTMQMVRCFYENGSCAPEYQFGRLI